MANYTKIVDFAAKDALNTGDPVKLVKGTELGAEYDAIAVAIATKANTASPAFTGVSSFAVGAVGAPSIYMTGYATTGWYNIGANNWGFAVSGSKVLDIASTGLAVTGTLSATGNISASSVSLPDGNVVTWGAGTTTYIQGNQASAYMNFSIDSVNRMALTSAGLAVTGNLNTATTTALSWGGDTTAGHTLGTRGTGSSLFINTGGLNTSYASGLAVDGSYSSLVSTVNIRALGTYSGGGYEAKLAFFTSSDTTQGQRMLLSSTGLAITGDISVSTKTPASAAAAGVAGTITWDANYLYCCIATNTWRRVAHATW